MAEVAKIESLIAEIRAVLDQRFPLDVILAHRPDLAPKVAYLKHWIKKVDKKTKDAGRHLRKLKA